MRVVVYYRKQSESFVKENRPTTTTRFVFKWRPFLDDDDGHLWPRRKSNPLESPAKESSPALLYIKRWKGLESVWPLGKSRERERPYCPLVNCDFFHPLQSFSAPLTRIAFSYWMGYKVTWNPSRSWFQHLGDRLHKILKWQEGQVRIIIDLHLPLGWVLGYVYEIYTSLLYTTGGLGFVLWPMFPTPIFTPRKRNIYNMAGQINVILSSKFNGPDDFFPYLFFFSYISNELVMLTTKVS